MITLISFLPTSSLAATYYVSNSGNDANAGTSPETAWKTINKVKSGLFWALIYNTLGIPIAAGILFIPFGFLLPAELAGLAMALSSVSVVTNALLLKRYKNPFVKKKNRKKLW